MGTSTVQATEAWVKRVFGSWEAYEAAKPQRYWVRGLYGWYSVRR